MAQKRKPDIVDEGYAVVVTSDRLAHATEGECWSDDDHLIGLKDAPEALAHGYALCPKCHAKADKIVDLPEEGE